jgi:hypothetical protein
MKAMKIGLSLIPKDIRWLWIVENVPEWLSTSLGMKAMLKDCECRDPMIDYLDKSFSKYADSDSSSSEHDFELDYGIDEIEQIKICQKIIEVYSSFVETKKGKALVTKVDDWFCNVYIDLSSANNYFINQFLKLLDSYLANHSRCSKLDKNLRWKLSRTFEFFSVNGWNGQSTMLLIAMAKNNFIYLSKMYMFLTNAKALEHALSYAHTLPNLRIRYNYVSVLKKAAFKHFKHDSILCGDMTRVKNETKTAIALEEAAAAVKYKL